MELETVPSLTRQNAAHVFITYIAWRSIHKRNHSFYGKENGISYHTHWRITPLTHINLDTVELHLSGGW
jgi:hypothetical protein